MSAAEMNDVSGIMNILVSYIFLAMSSRGTRDSRTLNTQDYFLTSQYYFAASSDNGD